jgi:ribosomal protein L16 Arg81 hydroxylase
MTMAQGPVELDRALTVSQMWDAPFLVRHHLAGHPLFDRAALVELARQRPASTVERHRGDSSVVAGDRHAEAAVASDDVIADIDTNRSWVVFAFVDHVPQYGALLDAATVEFRAALTDRDGPALARTGTVFVASPRSVTPAHFDRHHNILLQIEGTKELSVGEFDDDGAEARELQRHFEDKSYLADLPERFQTFTLTPGQGVYIPPYRPHWIVCHDDVAVALSCSVRTVASHRVELVHTFNSKLRPLGLHPPRPGRRPRLDAAKAAAVAARRRVQHARGDAPGWLRQSRKDRQ